MTDIKKNAPEGATHYLKTFDVISYFKKKGGDWCIFNDALNLWTFETIPKFIIRHFKPL